MSSDTKALIAGATALEDIGANPECAQAYRYLDAISRRKNSSHTSEYAARAFALHDPMNAPHEQALQDAQVIS